MKLIAFSDNQIRKNGTAITIGKFDGVHLGHQKLIQTTISAAKEQNLQSVVMLVYQESNPRITNLEKTTQILEEMGVDYVVLCPLNESFMAIEGEEFLKNVLKKRFSMKVLVTGDHFRFGKDGACDEKYLSAQQKKRKFQHIIVPSVYVNEEVASSSKIREFLEEGKVGDASNLLGYEYRISGECVRGAAIGRTIGFPTVNIELPRDFFLPKFGVYECTTNIDGTTYAAMGNLGVKPTVKEDGEPLFEAHILGFSGDLYGKVMTFTLLRFLRPERRFSSVMELKNQIQSDILEIQRDFDE